MPEIFRCRMVQPENRPVFAEVEGESPEDAASTYHFGWMEGSAVWTVHEPDGKRHQIYFARIEVEGHGEMVVRTYKYGLWRKGGVKGLGQEKTLKDIADAIGWQHDPAELIESGWPLEETVEEAQRLGSVR